MSDLTFYTNPMSRGRIARWMLEEVGVPYETVLLGYADTMKAPDYLAVNPLGKVPAIRHRGSVVTEVAAICTYLADAFPEAGLAPALDDRADYYRWLFFAAGPVEQAVTHKSMSVVPTDQQRRMVGYGSYDGMVEVLDTLLTGRDYVAADRFTAADVVVGSQINWGMQFGTLPRTDSFARYADQLTAREAYKRASALDDAAIAPAG